MPLPNNDSYIHTHELSRSPFGYNIKQTDEYISGITAANLRLSKENAVLADKLRASEEYIASLKKDGGISAAIEKAEKDSGEIVDTAYERADKILLSLKSSCNRILKNFRDETEEAAEQLKSMRDKVELFKRELIEKYRVHLEMINQISQDGEAEESISLTAEEYVDRVVASLKQEIYTEYSVSIDDIVPPAGVISSGSTVEDGNIGQALSRSATNILLPDISDDIPQYNGASLYDDAPAFDIKNPETVPQTSPEEVPGQAPVKRQMASDSDTEIVKIQRRVPDADDRTVVSVPQTAGLKRKSRASVPSISELLDGYDSDGAPAKADDASQLMFDLDDNNPFQLVESNSKKKKI